MRSGQVATSPSRRAAAAMGTALLIVGVGATAVPAAVAGPRVTPTVQSTSLTTSNMAVTSSDGQKLHLQLNATDIAGEVDNVIVTLSNGSSARNEVHSWTFVAPAGTLAVDSTGNGTLDVPSANLAPYGVVSLTISPIGSPTVQNCKGSPQSQTQAVDVTGQFFFDSRSAGTHRWGTVGSQEKFTFAPTNTVSWSYAQSGAGCVNLPNPPCSRGVFWESSHGSSDLQGTQSGKVAYVGAFRSTNLTTPAGAVRTDQATGTTKALTLKQSAAGVESLAVAAATNTAGSAGLRSSVKGRPQSQHCRAAGTTKTETTTTWSSARYRNGTRAFVVREQIFGSISAGNNSQATLSRTVIS